MIWLIFEDSCFWISSFFVIY